MGLRFSLESSESDAHSGPSSATRAPTSYGHQAYNGCPTNTNLTRNAHSTSNTRLIGLSCGENVRIPAAADDPRTMEELIRDLENSTTSDTPNIFQFLYSNRSRRLLEHRSNSIAAPLDHSTGSASSVCHNRHRHGRHGRPAHVTGGTCVSNDPAHSPVYRHVHTRRSRATASVRPSDTTQLQWSESDSDDGDSQNNFRLSTLMLRQLQAGLAHSNRPRHVSVPQSGRDLIRAFESSAARVTYNVDKLAQDKGECTICLEDLCEGDMIARLPCFCIYHKICIDDWFDHRPVCPQHPGD